MNHVAPIEASPEGPLRIPSYRPMNDRIVVQPDKVEEKICGGRFYLPQSVLQKKQYNAATGRVVAMGKGMPCKDGSRFPMPGCKVGDRVLFYSQGAIRLNLPEGEYLSFRDDFILAVLEEDEGT